jgi:hypothetical protein
MSIEAMKLALEALQLLTDTEQTFGALDYGDNAIDTLRTAIEQAEKQEPLFWYRPCQGGMYEGPVHNNSVGGKMLRDEKPDEWKPLFTTPPASPVQEPVAYRSRLASGSYTYCNTPQFFDKAEPLYATPPAALPAEPLTDEQIWKAIRPLCSSDEFCNALVKVSMNEYRAIEAAHGITKGSAA